MGSCKLNIDMKITAQKKLQGFTLIELLIVIGILAILLAITLVALNPAKQFAQSNNTKRRSDVNAILNAIHQYSADHKGLVSAMNGGSGIPTGTDCPTTDATFEISSANVNLCTDIVPTYMAALPVDPQTNNGSPITETGCTAVGGYVTNYRVFSTATNQRITVCAPGAELSETVEVTR